MPLSKENPEPRTLPVWLSIPLILLCLSTGGWIIHYYVMSDPISHDVTLLGDPPPPAQLQGRPRNANPRNAQAGDIHDLGNNRWTFRTMQAGIMVTVSGGKAVVNWIRYENDESFVPADAKAVNIAIRDKSKETALKLTDEQKTKLTPLMSNINMITSTAERAEAGNMILAYVQAAPAQRPALETKIYQSLDQIAKRSEDATRKRAIERAAQIKAILTPEQWTSIGGK